MTWSISALIVDAAIAITVVELVVLFVRRRRHGRAQTTLALLANVGAGLCLMFAVRVALAGAAWPWLAACLAAAGAAHAVDLRLRRGDR